MGERLLWPFYRGRMRGVMGGQNDCKQSLERRGKHAIIVLMREYRLAEIE